MSSTAIRPADTAAAHVIVLSLDGLPATTPGDGSMPTLDRLARDGTRAEWLVPAFPTLTFPNHYTLVTGLRPDRHGLVDNVMRDPLLPGRTFRLGDRAEVTDPVWWEEGEPLWVTAERAGMQTADQ